MVAETQVHVPVRLSSLFIFRLEVFAAQATVHASAKNAFSNELFFLAAAIMGQMMAALLLQNHLFDCRYCVGDSPNRLWNSALNDPWLSNPTSRHTSVTRASLCASNRRASSSLHRVRNWFGV